MESWKKALPCPRLWLELSKNPLWRAGLEQEPPVPQAEHSPGIQQVKPPCSFPCFCERKHTVWPPCPRKQEPPCPLTWLEAHRSVQELGHFTAGWEPPMPGPEPRSGAVVLSPQEGETP